MKKIKLFGADFMRLPLKSNGFHYLPPDMGTQKIIRKFFSYFKKT